VKLLFLVLPVLLLALYAGKPLSPAPLIPQEKAEKTIITITDTARNRTDLAFATALEQIYETEDTVYFFPVIYSQYVIVQYDDGTQEDVKTALQNNRCTIADLDRFNIEYLQESKARDNNMTPDCGKETVTVSYRGSSKGQYLWSHSFQGTRAAALSCLLWKTDCTEDICKCLPEYTVVTERGEYGISLAEGYIRFGQKQATLTDARLTELRDILQWAEDQVICGYPTAAHFENS